MLDNAIAELREITRSLRERNNRYYAEMQEQIPQEMKDRYREMCIEHKKSYDKLTGLEELKKTLEPDDIGHNEGEII